MARISSFLVVLFFLQRLSGARQDVDVARALASKLTIRDLRLSPAKLDARIAEIGRKGDAFHTGQWEPGVRVQGRPEWRVVIVEKEGGRAEDVLLRAIGWKVQALIIPEASDDWGLVVGKWRWDSGRLIGIGHVYRANRPAGLLIVVRISGSQLRLLQSISTFQVLAENDDPIGWDPKHPNEVVARIRQPDSQWLGNVTPSGQLLNYRSRWRYGAGKFHFMGRQVIPNALYVLNEIAEAVDEGHWQVLRTLIPNRQLRREAVAAMRVVLLSDYPTPFYPTPFSEGSGGEAFSTAFRIRSDDRKHNRWFYFRWSAGKWRLWHVSNGRRIHPPSKDPLARALESALTPADLELDGAELYPKLAESGKAFSLSEVFRPFERIQGDPHMLVVRVVPNSADTDGLFSENYLLFLDRGELVARRLVDDDAGGFSGGMERAQWRRRGSLLFGLGSSHAIGDLTWGGIQVFRIRGSLVTGAQSIWFPCYSSATFLSSRSMDIRAFTWSFNSACLRFRKTSPRLTQRRRYRFSGRHYILEAARIEHDEVWALDRLLWAVLNQKSEEVRRLVPLPEIRSRLVPALRAALHRGNTFVLGGDRLSLDDPAVPWITFGFARGEPYVRGLSNKKRGDVEN